MRRRTAGSAMVLTFFVFSSAFVIWGDLQLAATTSAAIKYQQLEQLELTDPAADQQQLLLTDSSSSFMGLTTEGSSSNSSNSDNLDSMGNSSLPAVAPLGLLEKHDSKRRNTTSAITLPPALSEDEAPKSNGSPEEDKNNRVPKMDEEEEELDGELVDLLMAGSEMRIITARPPLGIFTLKVVNTTMEVEEGFKTEKNNSVTIGQVDDLGNELVEGDLASAAAFNGRLFRQRHPHVKPRGWGGRGRSIVTNLAAPGFNSQARTPGLHSLAQDNGENPEVGDRFYDPGPRYNPHVGETPRYLTDDYYNNAEEPKVYNDYEYPSPDYEQPDDADDQPQPGPHHQPDVGDSPPYHQPSEGDNRPHPRPHHQARPQPHHPQPIEGGPFPKRNIRQRRPRPHHVVAALGPKPFTPHR